ncbi:MAG: NADH-quinone oxidoreductase subunit L [Dehalococcoidia bacterium]|nr:NADH-quinone oxidoreductase subunit L [Dehalococcoidia bacterium]
MLPTIPEGAVWAIFFLPLASFVIIPLFLPARSKAAGYVTIAAIGAGFVLSLWALDSVIQSDGGDLGFGPHKWLEVGALTVNVGITVDGLTGVMLIVVTGVSLMVQVYSQGYMAGDGGYSRYFTYMSLFTAAMLGLVLADNLLFVFVFWEMVGLCSYLLIGFWFHKPSAAAAAKKAFIVTRFGDLGFMGAILLIFAKSGTFDIGEIQHLAITGALSSGVITVFALGLLAGAAGKSAQFPLHVWLPDAMEGPTPVSALIHAATMVAAGVYLVGRMFPVFEASDDARLAVATVGGITALIAATMGVVMTDIKRVLAYSTISQLGYMMMALGVGAYVAAIFHLMNHAFFKALLFLGSGSVNHATNTFDMRKMGGLARFMPITFATFTIAGLSLAGVFPFAGFWSKDEILGDSWGENKALFFLAMFVVFLTSFYIFRAIFMTFSGEYRGGEEPEGGHAAHGESHGPHESPWVMAVPLLVLAVPSVLSGFANISDGISHLLRGALPEELHELHEAAFSMPIALGSTALALLGIWSAWMIYGARVVSAEALRKAFGPVHTLVVNKYYLDHLYENIIVGKVLYGGIGFVLATFDKYVVDGAVNGVAQLARRGGATLRLAQAGQLQGYAVVAIAGLLFIIGTIIVVNG